MLHYLKILLVFYLMLFTISKVWAQNAENFPPPDSATQIYAQRTSERITMDGMLLEASWKDAPVIEDFFRIEPRQGGNYLYKTQVRILYDDKNLYFGVFCADSLGKKGIRVQDYRRDYAFFQNDGFLIQLDPQNLKRYCMSFQTTPLGTQRDLQVFDDSFLDNDWDALWDVRTQITDEGYTAEFVIPFKSLRGGYYNGKLNTLTTGLRYAPIPNIAATLDYEWNQFKKVGILEQNSNTHLITGGLRLAYNPRWLLSVFYQYNSFNEQGRWNIRASWQFAPLSFIYLVWNDNYLRETDLRNQSTIAKITYLKQF